MMTNALRTSGKAILPNLLALALLAAGTVASAKDIDNSKFEDLLDPAGDVFNIQNTGFLDSAKNKYLYKWQTDKQEEAHYPAWGNSPKMLFMGFPIQESNVKFKDAKLDNIYISFFNRGDAGDMNMEIFNKLVADIDAKLGEWSGDKGAPLKRSKLNSEAKIQAKAWIKEPYALVLKWSSSGNSKKDFIAEYAQLEIERFDPKDDPRKQSVLGISRDSMQLAKNLPENIKRDDNKDNYIAAVPMVDQGQKGYCVAASASRVLKYYGMDVSQHDIAQIASSDSDHGTDIRAMITAIKKVSGRYGVKIREYCKPTESSRDIEKTISKYNTIAKKEKRAAVSLIVRGNVYYPDETIDQMSPELFKKMKLESEKTEMKGFVRDLKSCIDRGIPALWCVALGRGGVQEEKLNPQNRGPHMRLIIGYNEDGKCIIYTDSWGSEHAFKKMSYDDAWVITTELLSMDPLK